MKAKELAAKLLETPEIDLFIHAGNVGEGCDSYAPLDDIITVTEGLSLGSTSLLSGDGPYPLTE